jgi:hypothetical protein
MLHRRRHAAIPAHRTQADEQIQQLTQRNVQRSDAAADRRRQRAFDADVVLAKGLDGFVRQPVVELLEGFLARVDFLPRNFFSPSVRLLDGGVEDAHAGAPDVAAGAIAFDERNDRIVRHDESSGAEADCVGHNGLGQVTCRRPEDFREGCGKLCGKHQLVTRLLR